MKPKALLPLVLIFIILAVLVFAKKSKYTTTTLTEQVQLKALVPDELDTSTIDKLELYAGPKPDEKIILSRSGDDTWTLESHYNAPVTTSKINGFLDSVKTMKGEFRASSKNDQLGDYNLTNELGFHTIGYASDGSNQVFHVLVGKAPGFGEVFMRADGSNDVYLVDVDLRREAAIYSPEPDDPPKLETWLDKNILALDGETIEGLEIVFPDKTLIAEKHIIEVPKEEAPAETESMEETGQTDPVEPETETIWKLTQGGINEEDPLQAPFNNLITRLGSLTASSVADPAKAGGLGMDPPNYSLTIKQSDTDDIVIRGGRPDTRGPAYIRLEDGDSSYFYQINKMAFEELFAQGTDFFEMPGLHLDDRALTKIEYQWPDGQVSLSKSDGVWMVNEPKVDLPVDTDALDDLERNISAWQAVDYADKGDDTGLEAPSHSITFATESESHTIALGLDATHTDGRYAQLDDLDHILVMPKQEIDSIFDGAKSIYVTRLFDVNAEDIAYIELSKGDESYTLDQKEDGWYVVNGEETFMAKEGTVNPLASALSSLEAEDFILDASREPGKTYASIYIKTVNDKEYRATIEEEQDVVYPTTLPGVQTAYVLNKPAINRAFPSVDTFRPEEELEIP